MSIVVKNIAIYAHMYFEKMKNIEKAHYVLNFMVHYLLYQLSFRYIKLMKAYLKH